MYKFCHMCSHVATTITMTQNISVIPKSFPVPLCSQPSLPALVPSTHWSLPVTVILLYLEFHTMCCLLCVTSFTQRNAFEIILALSCIGSLFHLVASSISLYAYAPFCLAIPHLMLHLGFFSVWAQNNCIQVSGWMCDFISLGK